MANIGSYFEKDYDSEEEDEDEFFDNSDDRAYANSFTSSKKSTACSSRNGGEKTPWDRDRKKMMKISKKTRQKMEEVHPLWDILHTCSYF